MAGSGKHPPTTVPRARRRRGLLGVATVAVTVLLGSLVAAVGAAPASAATVDTTAWYVLVNRNSGKALDVYNLATDDGARITQWTRGDGAWQQWQFVDSGNGHYRLKSRHSGKVLDVHNFATTDGAPIVQWTDGNGTNQQFRLADSADGYVRLLNRNSGKALEVQGAATTDGANVVQYTDWGGANQQWQLVRVGSDQPGTGLPSSLRWSSSGVLAGPKSDATHNIVSIKDYTVVRHNNQWQVYATTASRSGGWNLVHFAFPDWPQAAGATHTFLDTASGVGTGYRAAPHLFYFAPQNLWYLVYQTGLPSYSTSSDPSNPRSWSAPRNFMSAEPDIVRQNKGNGHWLDFWVICDSANCHLFSSDDNGHIYRAQTSLANFPNGFGNTVIALQDANRNNLFEGTAVYKVGTSNQYLLLQEAIGSTGRYYKSFTSNRIEGPWSPHAASESNPFARTSNTTFPSGQWTRDISHGELIRSGNDQTLPISPCRLQFLYQGLDPNAGGEYSQLPYRMGLLTQTNSPC